MNLDAVILKGVSSSALYRESPFGVCISLCWEGRFFFHYYFFFISLMFSVFPSLPGTAQTLVSGLCL